MPHSSDHEQQEQRERSEKPTGERKHSDLETVGDIGTTGKGSRAGEERTSMGTTGAAEMGDVEGGLREQETTGKS